MYRKQAESNTDFWPVFSLHCFINHVMISSLQEWLKGGIKMDLYPYLKSMAETDRSAVVICNLEHEIIYMNPVAVKRYEKWGGAELLGKNLLDCHGQTSGEMIRKVVDWFGRNQENNIIYTSYNPKENKDVYMVALRDEDRKLIGYYEKHEYRSRETEAFYDFGTP